ncbi:MAG: insulinase family protein [Blastocatellia bacterium]|nr:insulinase family protein [Blastocatellia bacterium]
MKKQYILSRRIYVLAFIMASLAALAAAQGQGQGQAPTAGGHQEQPSMKGAVIKGKAPVNKEVLKVQLPKPYETKLANGLQVIVLENHKLPTFSMQMVILSGGLADAPGEAGAAQYVASMLREGTKTRTSRQIAEDTDKLGASLSSNATYSSLTTSISASGLEDNFDQVLDLFADVILNPVFPADELNKLKTRALASIRLQRASPSFLSNERFQRAIYGSHPASRVALTPEEIQSLTPEILQKYYAVHYRPNNAIFAISGDVKPSEVLAKLEKAFTSWKPGVVPKTKITKAPEQAASKVYLIDRPNSAQVNVVLGTLAIERKDPDYFPLEVMNQVLGGGPAARLFLNLREEKSYTYGAYSGVSSYKYRGTFRANTEIRQDVLKPAIGELIKEIKRIRDEKIPAAELEAAKRTIIGGWALQLEYPQSMLSDIITRKIFGLPADYWDKYPEKIAAVTPEEAQRVARKYLALDKLQIVVVGDAKTIAESLKDFGKVEVYKTDGKPISAPAASTGAEGNK